MPETKRPWRTLVTGGPTGRFTREQIRKAVLEVKAEREAQEARQKKQQRRK
jgi:hypothetical protein